MVCAIETDVTGLFTIAVALMVFIIALIYMAAQFFRRPEWETIASLEIYQVVISVVLWAVVAVLALGTCTVSERLIGDDPFDISVAYLNNVTYVKTMPAVMRLWETQIFWQYLGSIRGKIGPGGWGIIFHVFPFAEFLEGTVDFLLIIITPFVSSLLVQLIGLQLIEATMLRFVLPVGVLLRVIPFTRDAGSFLIATAAAFYIIFPMTYVMHAMVLEQPLRGDAIEQEAYDWATGVGDREYIDEFMDGGLGVGGVGLTSGIRGLAVDWLGIFFGSANVIAYTVLQAVFLPALSLTITVTAIKASVKFIGQKLS